MQQEISICLNGLAHDFNNICNEIDIPEVTNDNVSVKRLIKSKVQKAITEQNRNNILSIKKVADRVSENSSDNNYLDRTEWDLHTQEFGLDTEPWPSNA